jgi:hypothetical protein
MTSISEVLGQMLRSPALSSRTQRAKAFAAWSRAAGPAFCRCSRPVRMQDGEMTVEVSSSAHLHELKNFEGEGIRHRANAELGRELIHRVVFRPKR